MTLSIYLNLHFEAITRCTLYSSQSAILAANAKAVLASLLDQVGQYLTEGLERAIHSLIEATALRARFRNSGVAAAGECSFRSFMVLVQCCCSSVAIVQQYFTNSISL